MDSDQPQVCPRCLILDKALASERARVRELEEESKTLTEGLANVFAQILSNENATGHQIRACAAAAVLKSLI
jgi:hypothetical protein